MARSLITRAVLPSKPIANTDAHLIGVLEGLGERVTALTLVPGSNVILEKSALQELLDDWSELNIVLRMRLNWQAGAA